MKKTLSIIVWSSLLALTACAGVHLPPKPGPTPAPAPAPAPSPSPSPSNEVRTIAFIVRPGDVAQANCTTTIETPFQPAIRQTTDANGYVAMSVSFPSPDPGGALNAKATIGCPGFEPFADSFVLAASGNQDITFGGSKADGNQPLLRPGPVQDAPWLRVTDAQLRAVRGAISTTLMSLPCGPRPNKSDNVLFTAEFGSSCFDQATRAAMLATYRARSYTHWAIGPIESGGYSGQFPGQDWTANADGFADLLEQLWRGGQVPIVFLLPDTGFCADGRSIDWDCVEQRLTPIYASPRYQALVRFCVLAWEADYDNADYIKGVKWMARVFPNAKRDLHFESGHAAPCRGSELAESGGPIANEAACWKPVAPYLHGFLAQNTWTFGGENIDGGRTPKQQFLYNLFDMGRRLVGCETGWPCTGADGQPIDVVNFEYGSYYVYRHGAQFVQQSIEWGDAPLIAAPFTDPGTGKTVDTAKYITGYGDGGTLTPRIRSFSLAPSTSTPRRFTFSFTPQR